MIDNRLHFVLTESIGKIWVDGANYYHSGLNDTGLEVY